MKIFLILPILTIAIPFIIGGICLIKDHIKTIKKDKAQLEEDKQWFYNKVWNGNWENEGEKIDIRNIPQLSFEKWLIFYNAAPERWEIDLNQCNYASAGFCGCAIKKKKKGEIDIDTFWKTPEDLYKFMEWQKNEFQKGDVAIF